jgi:hypothetical protein
MHLEMLRAESVSQCLELGLRLHSHSVRDAVQQNAAAWAAQLHFVRPYALKWLAKARQALQRRVRELALLQSPHGMLQGSVLQPRQQDGFRTPFCEHMGAIQGIPQCVGSLPGSYTRLPAGMNTSVLNNRRGQRPGVAAKRDSRVQSGCTNFGLDVVDPPGIPLHAMRSHIIQQPCPSKLSGMESMQAQSCGSLDTHKAMVRHMPDACSSFTGHGQATENCPPYNLDSPVLSKPRQAVQTQPYRSKPRTHVCSSFKPQCGQQLRLHLMLMALLYWISCHCVKKRQKVESYCTNDRRLSA